MRFDELTPEQRQQRLATAVRNHLTHGSGAAFSPWYGADFCYQQGQLCRRAASGQLTPVASAQDLLGKSDAQIWKMVKP